MLWPSLILVTLAVARLTRLVVVDEITRSLRRWVVNRSGEDSVMAYFIHCSWCTSIWFAVPAAIAWAFLQLPVEHWWVALPAALAMSYVTGFLSQILTNLEER